MPKLVPNTQTGSLTDNERGTNDALIGVDPAFNILYGDAFSMFENARGGNDQLTGGSGVGVITRNTPYGDAFEMHDNVRGGNDQVTGGRWPCRDQQPLRRRSPYGWQQPRWRRHADREL